MMETQLFQKVYGCLLGGLIGDAMGAPVEGKPYQYIEEHHGEVNDFEGAGTDDSAIKLILSQAIIENGGYVTADEFAESFLKNRDKYDLFYIPVRNMFHKIECKLSLPVYAGIGNMQSSSSAMSISPMGLINACNPRQAAIETFDVAGLIHAGDSTFCRDGACAMAAAVAEAMKPGATVEAVLEASTDYLHKTSSAVMIKSIKGTLDLAKSVGEYKKFRENFYKTNLREVISDSRETVPCALAFFFLAQGDPVKAIIYGANFGRDADTIATMAGALAGAFKGVNGLKQEWIEKVTKNNTEQAELAAKIVEITHKRVEQFKNNLKLYDLLYF